MKLRLRFYFQIIMMFAIPFVVSLIIQYTNLDLGDWICDGISCSYSGNFHSDLHEYGSNKWIRVPDNHWGFRHWMLNLAGLGIWITNLVFMISDINKASENKL